MYRIVHNEITDHYRVEKRGLLGWTFVTEQATQQYLEFSDLESAKQWVRQHARPSEKTRRWQVVTDCAV